MIVVTISEVTGLILLGVIILLFLDTIIISIITSWFNKKFRQNCYECKHYYLKNVASFGDCCWYACDKDDSIEDRQSMNDRFMYRKCKEFKCREEDKSNEE